MARRNKRASRRGGLRPQDSPLSRTHLQRKQRSIKRQRGQDNFTATGAILLDAVRRKAVETADKRNEAAEADGSKFRIDPQAAADRAERDLIGETSRRQLPLTAAPLKQERNTIPAKTLIPTPRYHCGECPIWQNTSVHITRGQSQVRAKNLNETRRDGQRMVDAVKTANQIESTIRAQQERERKAERDTARKREERYEAQEQAAQAVLDKYTDIDTTEPDDDDLALDQLEPMRRDLTRPVTQQDEDASYLYQRSIRDGNPLDGLALARAVHDRRPPHPHTPRTTRRATHLQRKGQRQVRQSAKRQDNRAARHAV